MASWKNSTWHVLDIASVPVTEFASALSKLTPALAWRPQVSSIGVLRRSVRFETIANPPLRVAYFPVQRGCSSPLIQWISRSAKRTQKLLLAQSTDASKCPLVCTSSFYAPVAERWPGPVVYYLTDLTTAYEGINGRQVRALDERLCRVAHLVCANSRRIGDYVIREAHCDSKKVVVIPNATRLRMSRQSTYAVPGNLPPDIAELSRPIAGVIGNLAGNLDWMLLREAIDRSPSISWVFVGPTSMKISEVSQRNARDLVISNGSQSGSWGGNRTLIYKDTHARSMWRYCHIVEKSPPILAAQPDFMSTSRRGDPCWQPKVWKNCSIKNPYCG